MLASVLAVLPIAVLGADPASSWLTYAVWKDPEDRKITALNTTWIVPSNPAQSAGSNAPGWWFGIQTKGGNGALVQPILAYGYQGDHYSIFHGVFDWNFVPSWHTSDAITVLPGDKIVSGVTTSDGGRSYDMYMASTSTGQSVTFNYKLNRFQKGNESAAYFVLEHQPETCVAYPSNGECTFEDIYLEVDGQEVESPVWEAVLEKPACNSQTTIVDSKTIKMTWDASDSGSGDSVEAVSAPYSKWASQMSVEV